MSKHIRYCIGFVCALIVAFQATGEEFSVQSDSLKINTTQENVTEKQFTEELSTSYTERTFDYNTAEGESQNLLSRLLSAFFNWLAELFGFQLSPDVYQVVETVLYILMIIGAVYVMTKLLFGEQVSLFRPKQKHTTSLTVEEETIEETDIDSHIQDAIAQRQYREAIRYLHLKVLQQLSLKQLINWHFEKTNSDYYRELNTPDLKERFQKVAYVYDYVWYGEFVIDEPAFQKAKKQFDAFLLKLEHYG